jgi:hypothetical protein
LFAGRSWLHIFARLPEERRARFADAVAFGVSLPLDYVRLNVSAIRGPA